MIELNQSLVFEETSRLDICFCFLGQQLPIHERPRIIHFACVYACHKSPREYVQKQALYYQYRYESRSFNLRDRLDISGLEVRKHPETTPQQTRIDESGHHQVQGQPIWANSRSALIFGLLLDSTPDHPVSNDPLQPAKPKQQQQSVSQPRFNPSSVGKEDEGKQEEVSQIHPYLSVNVLNRVYSLKLVNVHPSVHCLVLY